MEFIKLFLSTIVIIVLSFISYSSVIISEVFYHIYKYTMRCIKYIMINCMEGAE